MAAKMLAFHAQPLRIHIRLCSICGEPYEVAEKYRGTLCGECALIQETFRDLDLKKKLAEKRAQVPHNPIGVMAIIGICILAVCVVALAWGCVAAMGVGAYK